MTGDHYIIRVRKKGLQEQPVLVANSMQAAELVKAKPHVDHSQGQFTDYSKGLELLRRDN